MEFSSSRPRSFDTYAERIPTRTEWTSDFTRFTFDTRTKFCAFEVDFTEWDYEKEARPTKWFVRYLNKEKTVNSAQVFNNPKILPFAPSLSSRLLEKDRRFSELCSIHGDIFPFQRMYRINDRIACDAFGRVFIRNESGFWVWKPLNLGRDHRGTTTIGGISKPSYYWPGIAGFDPAIQARIFDTPSIEIHHTTENTLVFAPSHLAPMPAALHRDYVHYSSRPGFYFRFFRYWGDQPWRPFQLD